MNHLRATVIAFVSCSCCIVGCKDEKASSAAIVHQQAEHGAETSDKLPAQEPLQEFRGTIVKMGWAKNIESWNAGGSEYYVLDRTAFLPADERFDRSVRKRLTLRETDLVSFETIESFVGKQVVIKARYVERPIPNREEDRAMQAPIHPVLDANGKIKLDSNGEEVWESPSKRYGHAVESIEEDVSR